MDEGNRLDEAYRLVACLAFADNQGNAALVDSASTDIFDSAANGQQTGQSNGDFTARAPKRALPSNSPPRSTLPTSSFLPVASTSKPAASPALAALTAFLNAKKDGHMSKEDMDVLRSLHNNIEAENVNQREGEVHTPNKAEMRLGGWSAGTPRETPRYTKAMPGLGESTPVASSVYNTPGSAFALGSSTPLKGTPSKANPYQVRYLGPGMSPRRMLGKATSSSGIKPLFQFSVPAQDESATKKRRVKGTDTLEVEVVPSTPSKTLSGTQSMPNLAAILASPAVNDKGKSRAAPHPLSQSITSTPPRDPVAVGKRRAADIMLSLIEEQTAPIEAAKANGAHTSDIIINPYDVTTPQSAAPSTPASKASHDTPRKSILRSSVRETPMRGAAAKLEANRGRPLSTLERASGVKPWAAPSPRKVKLDLPAEEKEKDEVDDMFESSPAPTQKTVPAEPPRKSIPAPEPFKAPEVPVLDTPARPLPTHKSSFTFHTSSDSPSRDAALASFSNKEALPKAPSFDFTSTTAEETPKDAATSSFFSVDTAISSAAKKTDQFDSSKLFLSAKDSALKIDKAALPFYTFTMKPAADKDSESAKQAKATALKATPPAFAFTLAPSKTITAATASHTDDEEWSCDLCMLKNPASAKEKCTICEAPRPAAKSTSAASGTPSAFTVPAPVAPAVGPPTSSEWTCSLCMLKNPGSAKEKCQICEAPRPAPVATTTAAPTPFQFGSFAPPKRPEGEWTCSVCMCHSPSTAQKCVVCESPRS